MFGHSTTSGHEVAPSERRPADIAYRRAWWSFALYPVTTVAAFVIGEGLYSALTHDTGEAAVWQVLLAGTPALLVFLIPGVMAATYGRTAMRLGREDGSLPALLGLGIGAAFVILNLASYVVTLLGR